MPARQPPPFGRRLFGCGMLDAFSVEEHQQPGVMVTPGLRPPAGLQARLAPRPGADHENSVVLYELVQ